MNDAVMQASQLVRHYRVRQGLFQPAATVKALDGVSFTLQPCRTLAVVGESGCGKSTLARQLTLIEPPTAGALHIGGVDAATATKPTLKQLRQRVQMVFQNPYASLNPRKTIAAALAAKVGLRPEHLRRYPHMFSGGQRQRIAIARAMVLNPGIVVADEPVSALDVSIQAQILNLFMDLQDEFGTGYVFISHNLSVVQHVADEVMVMYLGAAVAAGPKVTLVARPLHPYTRALMSATPALRAADRRERIVIHGELPSPLNPPSGCSFHKRCPLATERCGEEAPTLRELDGRRVACHAL